MTMYLITTFGLYMSHCVYLLLTFQGIATGKRGFFPAAKVLVRANVCELQDYSHDNHPTLAGRLGQASRKQAQFLYSQVPQWRIQKTIKGGVQMTGRYRIN